jgi:hypothetical protein
MFRSWLVVSIAALLVAPVAQAAELEGPAIRTFDLPTIERLGREMHEQDQWTRKATDAMAARRSVAERKSDGLRGWIAGRVDGKTRVRFIGGTGDKIEALYDVVFDANGIAVFSVASDRTLSAEELAQHAARELARSGASEKCSKTYSTLALKDPAGDGWLVWALATTTDADAILVGGHFRFTVSADGTKVTAKDELSKGCLKFSRRQIAADGGGAAFEALTVSHIVSLTPVETHVFAQLSYQVKIIVGTLDGRAWKIDGGSVTLIDMDMPGFEGFAARIGAGFAERCRIIALIDGEDPPKFTTADAPSMILATEGTKPFSRIELPRGYTARSVVCARLDIVPAPNDYKIVVAGYPLYIADTGVGHPQRLGVLELSGGQFRFRITDGPALTEDLIARVTKRLDGFQNAAQAKTVSLSASAQSALRAALSAGAGTFANVGEAEAATGAKLRQAPPLERIGYVVGNAQHGFEARWP